MRRFSSLGLEPQGPARLDTDSDMAAAADGPEAAIMTTNSSSSSHHHDRPPVTATAEESHFAFYAFEAATGHERWSHTAGAFVAPTAASWHSPHHSLAQRSGGGGGMSSHAGEMPWDNFHGSVLASLPHRWGNRDDTRFELAHITRTRKGQDPQAQQGQRAEAHVTDLFGGARPHASSEHVQAPNAFVAHVKDGIQVMHFYTGRPLTRIALQRGEAHADLNQDRVIEHVAAVVGTHSPYLQVVHDG